MTDYFGDDGLAETKTGCLAGMVQAERGEDFSLAVPLVILGSGRLSPQSSQIQLD